MARTIDWLDRAMFRHHWGSEASEERSFLLSRLGSEKWMATAELFSGWSKTSGQKKLLIRPEKKAARLCRPTSVKSNECKIVTSSPGSLRADSMQLGLHRL